MNEYLSYQVHYCYNSYIVSKIFIKFSIELMGIFSTKIFPFFLKKNETINIM